ncbi:hypothetical protein Sango_2244600 [Sesamum angolense]|uniref:Nucleotide-diphospho-sugar transferase domain-containing protein n=1 Tax=Sesamum angolense TaxID=2727404 RepID=A0AAE2BKU3_9LAMI|nr:hypothetical protein Sango_2244600 [Sesamum angolense]
MPEMEEEAGEGKGRWRIWADGAVSAGGRRGGKGGGRGGEGERRRRRRRRTGRAQADLGRGGREKEEVKGEGRREEEEEEEEEEEAADLGGRGGGRWRRRRGREEGRRRRRRAAMADNRTVIITTLNAAWTEPNSIFDLFLESFRIGNQTQNLLKHVVVVALDQKAYARCLQVHLHCYALTTAGVDFSGEAFFMSRDYLKMMWRRIDFLRTVLEMGYDFVFTDADIIWFRNPFLHFYTDDTDFQIACDHFGGSPDDLNNAPNGGFKYVKSNNRTIEFYKLWYKSREVFPGKHDQDVLNNIKHNPYLKQIGLKIKFLDTAFFGGFCQPSKDLNLVTTMHANCCAGLDNKINDLTILLDDWQEYLALPDHFRKRSHHHGLSHKNAALLHLVRIPQERRKLVVGDKIGVLGLAILDINFRQMLYDPRTAVVACEQPCKKVSQLGKTVLEYKNGKPQVMDSDGGSRISIGSQMPQKSGINHQLNPNQKSFSRHRLRTVLMFTTITLACLVLYQASESPFRFLPGSIHSFALSSANNFSNSGKKELGLKHVLKKAAMPDKTVIITTLNEAWIEPDSIFDLFLESFRIGNETSQLLKHLVVVALDQNAFDHCLRTHLNCYFLTTEDINFSDEAHFMTPSYLKMMWRRIDFLRTVLETGYNFVFTLWGNPTELNNAPNGGFNYVKSSTQTIEFYKFWYEVREFYPRKHDQDVLNKIKYNPFTRDIGLEIKFLDTAYFGGFCQPSKDLNLVCTMHANCCAGLDNKIHDLKILLEDWRNYLSLPENVRKTQPPSWSVPQSCG